MKPPAFQFYPDDFLGGTVTMSNCERGLYISLLCIQWSKGVVSKSDIDRIATPSFTGDVAIVIGKFKELEQGVFQNERLEKERKKQTEYRDACSSAGKSGASKRWGRHGHPNQTPLLKNGSPSPSPITLSKRESIPPVPVASIVEVWNSAEGLKSCLKISNSRKRSIESRLKEPFFVANWKSAIDRVAKSRFCTGTNDRGWKANIDWFTKPDTVIKIMEGAFDNNGKPSGQSSLEGTIQGTLLRDAERAVERALR